MTIPNLPLSNNFEAPEGVGIKDADTRKIIGAILWILSITAGVVSMFVQFFPEVGGDGDIVQRSVAFTNAVVSFLSGVFGMAVTNRNIRN